MDNEKQIKTDEEINKEKMKEYKEAMAMLDRAKQFKFIPKNELAKLSVKERQEYLARLRQDRLDTGKMIAYSLRKGLEEGIITR